MTAAPTDGLAEVLALQGRDPNALNLLRGDKDSALFPELPWEELIPNSFRAFTAKNLKRRLGFNVRPSQSCRVTHREAFSLKRRLDLAKL